MQPPTEFMFCSQRHRAARALNALVVSALCAVASAAFAQARPAPLPPAKCPQPRQTQQAPAEYLERKNPFSVGTTDLKKMDKIYFGELDNGANCVACHGAKGDGRGPLAMLYTPPPRNFICAQTMKPLADGQLFWIIKNGSPETAMPPHPRMSDDEIWQMVVYLRQL
jgi:mono/diheme cytochrome c family protein